MKNHFEAPTLGGIGLALLVMISFAGCSRAGMDGCVAAVSHWVDQQKLPLPALPTGPRTFHLRTNWPGNGLDITDADGGYVVQIWDITDRDHLIATYDVAYDGDPPRYRLVAARTMPDRQPLAVDSVPSVTAPSTAGSSWSLIDRFDFISVP